MTHHSREEGSVRAYLEASYTLGFHLRQVCPGMVTGTGQKMEKEKDGAYQELFPRGRGPQQCIRVWPWLFKVAES